MIRGIAFDRFVASLTEEKCGCFCLRQVASNE